MRSKLMLVLLSIVMILAACSGQPDATVVPADEVTPVATVRRVNPGITNVVSNGIVTFTDSVSGVSLDYPEGWMMDQVRGGKRSPSVFVFTNYGAIPSLMDKISAEDTVIYLTIPQSKPDGTLAGMIDAYKQTWQEEGSSILSEEDVTLTSGRSGRYILLNSYLGKQFYYLFTQAGETLVFIEAYGNLTPVPAIALSVR